MWLFIKLLFVRFLLLRSLVGAVGSLLVLLPAATLLKTIGLPLLLILTAVGIPVLFVLLLLGLPIFLVLLAGAAVMGIVAAFLAAGFMVIKILLLVVLPVALVVWGARWLMRSRDGAGASSSTA